MVFCFIQLLVLFRSVCLSQALPPPEPANGFILQQVKVPFGVDDSTDLNLLYDLPTANANRQRLTSPAWTRRMFPYPFGLIDPAPCSSGHCTSANKTYEHAHVQCNFPVYSESGVEITADLVAEGWRRYYKKVYGGGFVESGTPDMKLNCHAFSFDYGVVWVNDAGPILRDEYQTEHFNSSVKYFGLDRNGYGGFGHSKKFKSWTDLPSGFGWLETIEKNGDSQFFTFKHITYNYSNALGSEDRWKPN